MTAGDRMHARMERHRQMQQERRLHPEEDYSGPWSRDVAERDGSDLARRIRADVERRQKIDLGDEDESTDEGTDEDTSMSSSSPDTSTSSSRTTSSLSSSRTTAVATSKTATSSSSAATPTSTSSTSSSRAAVTPSSTSTSASRTSASISSSASASSASSSSSSSLEEAVTTSASSTRAVATTTGLSSSSRTTSLSSVLPSITTATSSRGTSVQVITESATAATASATASSTAAASSGPGVGLIIGIVAAALAGVVVVAAVVGFLVKKASRKSEPFEGDPFDKDEFRRQSAMIPEGFESDDGHRSMVEHRDFDPSGYGGDDGGYGGHMLSAGGAGMMAGAASAYGSSYNESGAPRPPTMLARHADAYRDYQAPDQIESGPQYDAAFAAAPQFPQMAYGGEDPYSLAGVAGGMKQMQNIDNPYAHLDRSLSASQFHAAEAANYYNNRSVSGNSQVTDLQRNGSGGTAVGSDAAYGRADRQETAGRPISYDGSRSGTPELPNVQQTYALGSEEGHSSDPSGRQSAMGTLDYPTMLNPYDEQQYYQHQQQQQQEQEHQLGMAMSSSPPPALQVRNLTGGHEGQRGMVDQYGNHGGNRDSAGSQTSDAAYGGVY